LTTRETIDVGSAAKPFIDQPLTRTDFVRYQGASGDMNPIHHDDEFARQAGYPSVFAPGMFAAGVLGSYLAQWLGPSNIRRFKVRFSEQAWPGDILTYTGKVVEIRDEANKRLVDVEAACTRQDGGTHVLAWATFELDA
jgi:acyl dehydratase